MNARDLIHNLGGPGTVAPLCGVTAQAVSNWYKAGIPARHHLTLWRLAQARGIGWRPPNADGLALRPDRTPLTLSAEAA